MRELIAEQKKWKHLNIWMIPLSFLGILFLWTSFKNLTLSDAELAQGYSDLLYQIPLMNCIFMPIFLAILASRVCDMEIKGQTTKLLFTLQKSGSFYDLKFLWECRYLLLFVVGEGVIIASSGVLFGFTERLSCCLLFRHMVVTFLTGAVILNLQHFLSLLSSNQIFPLLIGLVGAFLGLFSMFFPTEIARFVPWSYFGAFTPFAMNWDEASRTLTYSPVPFPTPLLIGFTLFGLSFYLLCRHIFIRREI